MDLLTMELREQWVTGSVSRMLPPLVVNLLLTALLTWLLGLVYVKFGKSLSNRKIFAQNFLMLAMTTVLVISLVKSSLALSLGLVGALSIVRFRAAIKEPEELTYLFLAIGIGLGMGAGEPRPTICALVIIIAIIILRSLAHPKSSQDNVCVHISSAGGKRLSLNKVVDTLAKVEASANLRRFDETTDRTDFSFVVQFANPERLETFGKELRSMDPEVKISFVDDRGLGM